MSRLPGTLTAPTEREAPHKLEPSRLLKMLRGLVPLVLVLALWQLLGDPNSPTTPAPSAWWQSFREIARSGALWPAMSKTLLLYVEGLVVATVLGVALGTALGASRRMSRALGPTFEFLRATPAAAIVPGALLLFHASHKTEIGIVVYGSIWPVLLTSAAARSALSPLRLDVATTMRMSRRDRLIKFVLPSLLPDIVAGIRVAASICLTVTLLVDFLIATGGLGYLLVQYEQTFQASSAFALMAATGVIGILINVGLGLLGRTVLRRWPTGAR